METEQITLSVGRDYRTAFHDSLRAHQIKGQGIRGFSLVVNLMSSENDYLSYPVKGVITINEQGTDLSVSIAVFRHLKEDGSLGAPVVTKNPVFTYHDARVAEDAPMPRLNRRAYNAIVDAESFISGFEGDELQEGIPLLLGKLRTLIRENAA